MDTSIAEKVRLTVRFSHKDFEKEADVSLPRSSSLGEVLGELLALVAAPSHLRSWQATSAGGRNIDMTAPIGAVELPDGAIVVLGPACATPPPVIRDAAEALEARAGAENSGAFAALWILGGLLATAGLAAAFHPVIAAAGVGAVSFLLALWTRMNLLAYVSIGMLALSGGLFAGGGGSVAPLDLALTLLSAVLAAGCALGLCRLAGLGTVYATSLLSTWCGLYVVAAAGLFLPGPSSAFAGAPIIAACALGICFMLVFLVVTPSLTARLAGLQPPRIPTAGQDLAVSDAIDLHVEEKARRAQEIYSGILTGLTCGIVPALLLLAVTGAGEPGTAAGALLGSDSLGAGFAQALCITVAVSVTLHASRQGHPRAIWPQMIIAATAAMSSCLCAAAAWFRLDFPTPDAGLWVMSAVAVVTITVMVTAAVFASRFAALEPTAVVWLERAESLAIAASLPLALHLAGVFSLIRGLG